MIERFERLKRFQRLERLEQQTADGIATFAFEEKADNGIILCYNVMNKSPHPSFCKRWPLSGPQRGLCGQL